MAIDRILTPIKEDLKRFEIGLDAFVASVQNPKVKNNYQVFFNQRGKYLRPSLLYLSVGMLQPDRGKFDEGLDRLALILELLHSASLVHDDIVDDDDERRGHKTMNSVFGNKVAVLAGDTLFSYAFKEATLHYEKPITTPITSLALNMCMAELEQANGIDDLEGYLNMIQGKTADFMSVCCELGAKYVGADKETIQKMAQLGLSIGMTYQMIDDQLDQDPIGMLYVTEEQIDHYYHKALAILETMPPSDYLTSFKRMLSFIKNMK